MSSLRLDSLHLPLASIHQPAIWMALTSASQLLFLNLTLTLIHQPANCLAGYMDGFNVDWSRGGAAIPPLSVFNFSLASIHQPANHLTGYMDELDVNLSRGGSVSLLFL